MSLRRIKQIVKDNPWKITLGTVVSVVMTVGGVYFTDMRYVKRDEYTQETQQIQQKIKENVSAIRELRK